MQSSRPSFDIIETTLAQDAITTKKSGLQIGKLRRSIDAAENSPIEGLLAGAVPNRRVVICGCGTKADTLRLDQQVHCVV